MPDGTHKSVGVTAVRGSRKKHRIEDCPSERGGVYSAGMTNPETIADGKVIAVTYALSLPDGTEIEKSDEAFEYLHGAGNIIPGLEEALLGKSVGDHVDVTVGPEKAYGEHDAQGVQTASRENFPADMQLEAGMQFMTETDDGVQIPGCITAVEGEEVTVDFNHPLAGQTLKFSVDVLGVRDATPEETEHGHPHGAHDQGAHDQGDCDHG